MEEEKQKVFIIVERSLWCKVKALAALEGKTIAQFVSGILKEVIFEKTKANIIKR